MKRIIKTFVAILFALVFIEACTKKESPPPTPPQPFSATFSDGTTFNCQQGSTVNGSQDSGIFYINYIYNDVVANNQGSALAFEIKLSNDTVGIYPATSTKAGCGGSFYSSGYANMPYQVISYDSLGYVKITKSSGNVISGTFSFTTSKIPNGIQQYSGFFTGISCK